MALYAFDGTGNEDEDEDGQDSNVLKFCEVYGGEKPPVYLPGVGTRLGPVGMVLGGIFGAGGRSRIDEMRDALEKNYFSGDKVIDVIGFSRGAALAVHFCNTLAHDGIKDDADNVVFPQIRFLGVWDIVGSFGLAADTFINFQKINLLWKIDQVPGNVEHCSHAMALDERRETFGITRLNPDHAADNVVEMWFRGVHSDIGGGNDNAARSNIALNWMVDQAKDCGVPFNDEKLAAPKYSYMDVHAKVSENKDPKLDPRRETLDDDDYHASAHGVRLEPGRSHSTVVDSELKYNWSGVLVEKGARYQVNVDPAARWTDKTISCTANGWKSEQLPWYKEKIVEMFEDERRVPEADWFALCGTIDDDESNLFQLGVDGGFTGNKDGYLYLFANDLSRKYGNNKGSIAVTIERVV